MKVGISYSWPQWFLQEPAWNNTIHTHPVLAFDFHTTRINFFPRTSKLEVANLQGKLGVFPFLCVRLHSTPSQVNLEVPEDDSVPRNDHSANQAQEPPVLDVDTTVWLGLVRGLLDELQVELVAERLPLQALLDDQLHHAHTVFWVNLLKATSIGWRYT